MLDPVTDVDLAAGASVSVANVSIASTSVDSVSGCQHQLPVSLAASTSVASASGVR